MPKKQAPWAFVEKYYTEDVAERNTPETQFYLSWLKNVKGNTILSLGCGPNLYDDVQFFAHYPKQLVGVDLNKNNITFLKKSKHPELLYCKERLTQQNIKVKLIVGDISRSKKAFMGKFDAVYASGVIGMFKEKELQYLLKVIYGYLKPGGIFVDVDWTDCQLSKEKYTERESFEWYSKQGPSIKRISQLLTNTKFKVLKHKVYTVPNKKAYGWGKIYGYLAKKP